MEEKELKAIIDNYDYVSFDIYDTLIFRTVSNPEDIFDLVEKTYNIRYSKKLHGFRKARIKAEYRCRCKSYPNDITIQLIYENIKINNVDLGVLMNIEKECELNYIIPNRVMVELANYCKSKGKKVIITTDMYLDRNTLSDILRKIGCSYDRLYISGEQGYTKYYGTLFSYLISDLNISPSNIIHIGDNPHNDISRAKECGIEARVRLLDEDEDMRRMSVSVLAPLCADFCCWIHAIKEKYSLNKLAFLAREGYLLKKVYNLMYPEEIDDTCYVRLNKNILRLPSLYKSKDRLDTFLKSIPERVDISWVELFRYLLIEQDSIIYRQLIDKYPIINNTPVIRLSELSINKTNLEIINCALSHIDDRIKEQYTLFIEYVDQLGLNGKSVGLVNNSINGSGQFLLEYFLKTSATSSDVSFIGLQFSRSDKCIERLGDRCYSWIESRRMPSFYNEIIRLYCLIQEHLMFESCGTSVCLKRKDSVVYAVTEEQKGEIENNFVIDSLHNQVCKIVKTYKNQIVPYDGMRQFSQFVLNPSYSDALMVGNLYDDDYDGTKKINDEDGQLTASFVFRRHLPSSLRWPQGFLCANKCNKLYLYALNARVLLKYYINRLCFL